MRNRILFSLAILGVIAGIVGAFIFGATKTNPEPLFKPVSSPYQSSIYANGIIESDQPGGSNINIYTEVSGQISTITVHEGQAISSGSLLFSIEDSVQRANSDVAAANEKSARNQYEKRLASYRRDAHSISKDSLDTAKDNLEQTHAQSKAANALLKKYSVTSPVDGVVLAVNTTTGSYVSPQGTYNPYTQGFDPILILGNRQDSLAVRCYVDEILISRLPQDEHIRAEMALRGTDTRIPLEFVRIQPYVSPKIQISNQRQEKVALRVLPVIFRFSTKGHTDVYPGQLVDVFIGPK
jgi:HlyD family secretion protein